MKITFRGLAGWDFQSVSRRARALNAIGVVVSPEAEWAELPDDIREKLLEAAV
jgi:hypothetical protein